MSRNSQISIVIGFYSLLKLIRLSPNNLFNVSDSLGIKFLTGLRSDLSHLREHKFNRHFQDTVNPLRSCCREPESTKHFFCAAKTSRTDLRKCLTNKVITIDS